ncbi:hypothetical protein MG296_06655 [Flavobacteriaceae bacterium TK19130]|nr:hypothetical protein [Thermobacterium salinum]
MENITRILPISIINILNDFNSSLEDYRKEVSLNPSLKEMVINSEKFQTVSLRYSLKNTSYYFEIDYVVKADKISWKQYPYSSSSTKPRNRSRVAVNTNSTKELKSHFAAWISIISKTKKLENPLEYFQLDHFVEFYSYEVIEQIPTTENEVKFPLTSEKQNIAIDLISKQTKFIDKELSKINDKNSEEYFDFEFAKYNLINLKKELPRMTVSEVKQKWALSFGVIMKWAGDRFLKFIKIDKETGFDLSRAIGSFIGGVFGIPKLDQ